MLRIEFDTGNDAFETNWQAEAARILREIANTIDYAERVAHGAYLIDAPIRDLNGNKVGRLHVDTRKSLSSEARGAMAESPMSCTLPEWWEEKRNCERNP